MTLTIIHKDTSFGPGDKIKVVQKIKEGEKNRLQIFEGMVIALSGRDENKSFSVRRIGAGQIGVERIFPLYSPTIEKIEVIKKGTKGIRRGKLYYTRGISKREIDLIYKRAARRENSKEVTKKSQKK
ncbi:50S ribosomal protein L19 [Candidatus Woesebacteria bacterium RIFCSPHIGHO2_01_FULL_39_17]|uniref:50S ribosomal protein L19 n=3 Tax=Candidatus Woeseibacteriota TaxID=1752722 RepID=A0A0G0NDP3_9BACT|nr:MAG: 50S ribosomal protein L19 [Microgenomates group bacterium GW2011_GWC1_38_12]KKQ94200.1 MAG: 50S ribosomal protein L19 [Candidatus Woesebacteria bacterium GW2011_GWB1_39_10b]KKR14264.1 MAG: 50S ribosomal protein L19 [Candidatus Woesebacteria bacterium GW2011_GWA1_39_21b]OGM23666.1 MAG: 50S ribosomal protein L19 [Candidatus Woesebacteria bacterium RIFCSPHIGHO2_01_FULL_39_17]OGM65488.1 MAG: 50S ribosomal protein L19 [Candidatus Woesebacteria bacterium RIFCSPLOWO2_01_FULL_39_14]